MPNSLSMAGEKPKPPQGPTPPLPPWDPSEPHNPWSPKGVPAQGDPVVIPHPGAAVWVRHLPGVITFSVAGQPVRTDRAHAIKLYRYLGELLGATAAGSVEDVDLLRREHPELWGAAR